MISRNYEPQRIKRPRSNTPNDIIGSGARSILRGVGSTAKFVAKEGLREGAKILPELGEFTGEGLAVALDNPELAPAFGVAGKIGGKYLEHKAGEFINRV